MWVMYNEPLEKLKPVNIWRALVVFVGCHFREQETAAIVQSETSESFNQYT